MAEEARLESVYTSKAYPGFESPSLRKELGRGSAEKVNPRLSARNLKEDSVRFS